MRRHQKFHYWRANRMVNSTECHLLWNFLILQSRMKELKENNVDFLQSHLFYAIFSSSADLAEDKSYFTVDDCAEPIVICRAWKKEINLIFSQLKRLFFASKFLSSWLCVGFPAYFLTHLFSCMIANACVIQTSNECLLDVCILSKSLPRKN